MQYYTIALISQNFCCYSRIHHTAVFWHWETMILMIKDGFFSLLLDQRTKYYWQKTTCNFERFIVTSFLSFQCSQVSLIVDFSVCDPTLRETTWLQETVSASAFWGAATGLGSGWHGKSITGERGQGTAPRDRHRAREEAAATGRAGAHEGMMRRKTASCISETKNNITVL